jgi:hypothetical protein
MGNNTITLILMFEHIMPNVIVDKIVIPSNLKLNRNIKLSSLIAQLMRKNLFVALLMKYCHVDVNINQFKITDFN